MSIGYSHAYFSKNYVGDVANKVNDITHSVHMIIDVVFTVIMPLMFSIILSAFLFVDKSVYLSYILFTWFFIYFAISFYGCNKAAHLSYDRSKKVSALQGRLVDSFVNQLNVKLFNNYEYEYQNILPLQKEELGSHRSLMLYLFKLNIVLGLISFMAISTILFITFDLWKNAEVNIAGVIFIIQSVINITTLSTNFIDELTCLFKEIGMCKQGLDVLSYREYLKSDSSTKELSCMKGEIIFDNVSFHYLKNNNIFSNKSLVIKGGEKVGLVGLSGSGKTTFVHLILRLFDVDEGKISVDSQPINEVSLESLRSNICFVSQEPLLFHRSIYDNILYGNVDATKEDVYRVAKAANCHDFIMNLEHGYNTNIGEKGSKMSAGQKQRIVIARAMLHNTKILIMDEATSALDMITQHQVQDAINNLISDKTTIVIAHRLSTLLSMDRILVFDQGNIIEDGTHTQLLKKKGQYYKLWNMQVEGMIPNSSYE